ncbi:MAG: MBL fold metallo-hydrolase [Gemmatimonadetes bacterium]|nr:MBL fold metallo-hydrolase [Gemmatimonadota bacterium]
MIAFTAHDDVTQLEFTSVRSRLSGMRVSAFVVRNVMIDSGFPTSADELRRWVAQHPVAGAALTHYHEDHAGGASVLRELGVPLWMAEATQARLAAPTPVRFYRRFSWGAPRAVADFTPFALPPFLAAIPTPGHTADHQVFWDAETRTVFGGDLFIGVKVRIAGANEDPRAVAASLRRVIALEPRRYFDAHRGALLNPVVRLAAKRDWMEEMIGQCERLFADGVDDATIARRVLGADRIGRLYTGRDYTMENWVRGVRRGSGGARADVNPCAVPQNRDIP